MLTPAGHRVLVKPDYQDKTDWGLQLVENDKMGIAGTTTGIIVKVGENAWKAFDDGLPWAKEGDRILYGKYGGKIVTDPDTDQKYVVINDEDVICVITKETPNE